MNITLSDKPNTFTLFSSISLSFLNPPSPTIKNLAFSILFDINGVASIRYFTPFFGSNLLGHKTTRSLSDKLYFFLISLLSIFGLNLIGSTPLDIKIVFFALTPNLVGTFANSILGPIIISGCDILKRSLFSCFLFSAIFKNPESCTVKTIGIFLTNFVMILSGYDE